MTKFNVEKFRKLTQNGIWPVTPEGYQSYCLWYDNFRLLVAKCEVANKYSSGPNKGTNQYKELLNFCNQYPEMSVMSITYMMIHKGVSWLHLELLYDLTEHRNLPEHAGKFYSQVAMWLLYYDSLRYKND